MKIPIPSLINIWWNLGFILIINIIIQFITGLLLSINYLINQNIFYNNYNIYFNLNNGWLIKIIHINIVSIIYIIIFIHIIRNIYYNNLISLNTWIRGIIIWIILIISSFRGYILPWRQISYWGIIVISNILSIIPYLGINLIFIIWGNININLISLNRIFILHFIISILIMIFIIIHIIILHQNYSKNQLGLNNKIDIITLNYYFLYKDYNILLSIIIIINNYIILYPFILNNHDNFIINNKFITPNNIEPEWYFLLFYSILRSIPNKINGLIILLLLILTLIFIPKIINQKFQSLKFYFLNKLNYWILLLTIFILSLNRTKYINYPYIKLNIIFIIIYFILFIIILINNKILDNYI